MANLDAKRLQNLNRYWQAANYLTIGAQMGSGSGSGQAWLSDT